MPHTTTAKLAAQAVSRKKRVLIIEDDPVITNLIEFRLARDGYEIEKAIDGIAALAAFDTSPVPDLVLLDVMMPYHNGYELLLKLRACTAWQKVPVIMLTSMSREEDVLMGLQMGATDYVTKPFRPAELSARVKALIARAA
jgi:two-component system, OmpR family, alkaline phosphatase synthesis response regulator PhoP